MYYYYVCCVLFSCLGLMKVHFGVKCLDRPPWPSLLYSFIHSNCVPTHMCQAVTLSLSVTAAYLLSVSEHNLSLSPPSDIKFPWRQFRLSASSEDLRRWTVALPTLHQRTLTMKSPAVTVLTAVTASTPPPALHSHVRAMLH